MTLEIKFIPGYHEKYNLNPGEIAPQTFAMYWCMNATGMSRLFTRDHIQEFLFRLAIIMNSVKLVENWFGWDKFLLFSYNELEYSLQADDVISHFGLESINSIDDCISRENFLDSIANRITNAQFLGTFVGNFQVLKPSVIEDDDGTIHFKSTANEYVTIITDDLIKKAEFFANDILKNYPSDIFHPAAEAGVRRKEIEKRKEHIRNLPKFDFDKVPRDVVEDCFYAMFDLDYAKYLLKKSASEEYRRIGFKYLYLAWLFVNELLWIENGYDFNHYEGINFKPEEYADETGGFSIPKFIDDYNMKECAPYLKGLFIK